MKFAIYRTATGQIDQMTWGGVTLENVQAVCSPEQSVLEVGDDVSDATHYIADGVATIIPAAPDDGMMFAFSDGAWTDTRTLEQHQEAAWVRIKAARDAAINAPLSTPFGTFDADADSRRNLTDAILMLQTLTAMGQEASISWTLLDNTSVTLTDQQLVMVGLSLGARVQTAHATARLLRAAIFAATTAADVAAVIWPA